MRRATWLGFGVIAAVMALASIDTLCWEPRETTGRVLQVVDQTVQLELAGEAERPWWARVPAGEVCFAGDRARVQVLASSITGSVGAVESAVCGRSVVKRVKSQGKGE